MIVTSRPIRGAALIANCLKNNSCERYSWRLRWKPVCSSTETDLSRWLIQSPSKFNAYRAFVAGRQTHGKGQGGRVWESSMGGVWASAAFPLPKLDSDYSPGLLGLAVSIAIAERLERQRITVQIKWPNDLLFEGRKLAGLLPRLIYRGNSLRIARIGIGLNVCNRVPKEGISIAHILNKKNIDKFFWASEVLIALQRAISIIGDSDFILRESKLRIWAHQIKDKKTGLILKIEGFDESGALRLTNGSEIFTWDRWS